MNLILVVVVEDKEEERLNALEALKRALNPKGESSRYAPSKGREQLTFTGDRPFMVHFASNLEVARARVEFAKVLGGKGTVTPCVITDLMFPHDGCVDGKSDPNGLTILATCIRNGLPVVVCSDTDHHDVQYLKEIFPILGKAHPQGEIPVILDKKDWDKAVTELLRMLDAHADPSLTACNK